MRVLIFGATGGTGRELVRQSVENGYETSAFIHKSRNSKAKMAHDVRSFYGDVFDYNSVNRAMVGQDVVLVALGTRPGVPNTVLSEGTKNIVQAMQVNNVKRIIVETGAGLIEDRTKLPMLFRAFSNIPFMKDMFVKKREQEAILRESSLDWVSVRPTNLTNKPLNNKYRAGVDLDFKIGSTISRANVAHFMLQQVKSDNYLKKAVIVSE